MQVVEFAKANNLSSQEIINAEVLQVDYWRSDIRVIKSSSGCGWRDLASTYVFVRYCISYCNIYVIHIYISFVIFKYI